jgi:purine-binding chemotaxis protein CheW
MTMAANSNSGSGTEDAGQFVTVTVANQVFGIPVLLVRDVLRAQKLTPIPLATIEVAGVLNLRGRIVTAIDVRRRLGLPPRPDAEAGMSVVVEHHGEPYSLMVDSVGEVLTLSKQDYEHNPATLAPEWRQISAGIYRLDDQLLVVADVDRLLDFTGERAA